MSVNGPAGMYKLKPIYDFYESVQLPDCMYKMANIYKEGAETIPKCEDIDQGTVKEGKLIELEQHQEDILQRLEQLKGHLEQMRSQLTGPVDNKENLNKATISKHDINPGIMPATQDVVIASSPSHLPLSVFVFYNLLNERFRVRLAMHYHSSGTSKVDLINKLKVKDFAEVNDSFNLSITLIWKDVGIDPVLMVSPTLQSQIKGEVNIARYFARMMNNGYEEVDPVISTQIDTWLDMAHSSVFHGSNKEKKTILCTMNSCLGASDYLVGDIPTIADIILWSALIQAKLTGNLPANVNKWWKKINNSSAFGLLSDLVVN